MDVDTNNTTAAEARLCCIVSLFSAFIDGVQLLSEAQALLLHTKLDDTFNTCLTPLLLPVLDSIQTEGASHLLTRDYVSSALFLYVTLLNFDSFCRFRYLAPRESSSSEQSSPFSFIHSELPLMTVVAACQQGSTLARSQRMSSVLFQCISYRIQELFASTQAIAGANVSQLFKSFNKKGNKEHAPLKAELKDLIQAAWKLSGCDNGSVPKKSSRSRYLEFLSPIGDSTATFNQQFWASIAHNFPAIVSNPADLDDTSFELFVQILVRSSTSDSAVSPLSHASFWEIPRVYTVIGSVFLKEAAAALSSASSTQTPSKKSSKRKSVADDSSNALPAATRDMLLSLAADPKRHVDIASLARKDKSGPNRLTPDAIQSLHRLLSLYLAFPCWKSHAARSVGQALPALIKSCLILDAILREEELSLRADSVMSQLSNSAIASSDSLSILVETRAVISQLFGVLSEVDPVTACSYASGLIAPDSSSGESSLFLTYYRAVLRVATSSASASEAKAAASEAFSRIDNDSSSIKLVAAVLESTAGILLQAERKIILNKTAKRRARKHVIRDEEAESQLETSFSLPSWCLEGLQKLVVSSMKHGAAQDANFVASVAEFLRAISSPSFTSDSPSSRDALIALLAPEARQLLEGLTSSSPRVLRALTKSVSAFNPPLSSEEYGRLLVQTYLAAGHTNDFSFVVDLLQNSTAEQLHLVLEHSAVEMNSKQPVELADQQALLPVWVTVKSVLMFFEHVDRTSLPIIDACLFHFLNEGLFPFLRVRPVPDCRVPRWSARHRLQHADHAVLQ
jgi:hypothetical protein